MKRVHVLNGLDNLALAHDHLRGKRLGLLTHPCGYDSHLVSSIDILRENYRLTALFSCEHGLRGDVQDGLHIDDREIDRKSGLPIFSLYGKHYSPTPEMLAEIDTMVIDMQDVGARFYTFVYSMCNVMIACGAAGKSVVVLDRINPIDGVHVQGTLLDEQYHSFVGEYAMPTRHGLTIGEFALFVKDHLHLDVDLTIVPMTGWKRDMLWLDTDASWTPPSPNMPHPGTALVYPGTCIFEATNISEGRGTTTPFEVIGAPFIDGDALCQRMRALNLPDIGFMPASYVPTFSKWQGERCHGVRVFVNSAAANAFAAGLYLAETILDMYPRQAHFLKDDKGVEASASHLLGCTEFQRGALSAKELIDRHQPLVEDFARRKQQFHLYQ